MVSPVTSDFSVCLHYAYLGTYCGAKFVRFHCKGVKVNHPFFSLKINFCDIPHFILLCNLSPRNFLTIHWFYLLKFSSWICNPGALCLCLFCRKLVFTVVGLEWFYLLVLSLFIYLFIWLVGWCGLVFSFFLVGWSFGWLGFFLVEFPWQRGTFAERHFFKYSGALIFDTILDSALIDVTEVYQVLSEKH